MRRFAGGEIRRFLRSLDAHVSGPTRLDIIGGAAALLSYRAQSGTVDIDTTGSVESIQTACRAACKETGLEIPVATAAVYDGPHGYEGRLKRLRIRGLRRLQIFVPEKHDWALMKVVRCNEKDIEDILEVSRTMGFNRRTFLKRFIEEMSHVIGPPERLTAQFASLMEELYGEKAADRMEAAIRRDRRWKRK